MITDLGRRDWRFLRDGYLAGFAVYQCVCGTIREIASTRVRNGHSRGCGCKASGRTHGKSGTKTHSVWKSMRRRCDSPSQESYPLYGGRGISVCERWKSYENFLADMGEKPDGYSIEREDVNGNYEPGNCTWIPLARQQHNKRTSRFLTHCGETMTMADWASKTKLTTTLICWRLAHGWDVDRTLSTPARPMKDLPRRTA